MSKRLRIIPLGGLGEIGKNMTVLEYGRNMIVVDCGLMFPDNDMYGIDLVLPQFDYVVQNQDRLRGIVLTHGHMDHIGGLPYLMKHIKTTIYGTGLTVGMVKRQLDEANVLQQANLVTVKDLDAVQLGPFTVTFVPVAHSIPHSTGLVIDTPVGAVVHTGDYKLDETPAGGRVTDLQAFKRLTPDGILALLADSTNADKPGKTQTEKLVADTLDRLFEEAKGHRIIIATFASLLARVQEIVYLAAKHNRKIAFTGRSLNENTDLARSLGLFNIPKGMLVEDVGSVPDENLIIVATGSQGEPRSALSRIAQSEHAQISVHPGDTIIISGGTIPGNEGDVSRMLNKLFEQGANVIYGGLAQVHVSGHGSRDEIRTTIETLKPKFVIPVHGETRHLYLHARIAESLGMAQDHVFILKNGFVWATDGDTAFLEDVVAANDVFVDGRLVGEVGAIVMRDRQRLSQDGFVVALVPVNANSRLAGEPQIISRGFVHLDQAGDLLDRAREEIKRQFKRPQSANPHEVVRDVLQDFLWRETQSRPIVLPSIIRV